MKRKRKNLLDGGKSRVPVFGLILCIGWWAVPALAEEEAIPWECSEYTGDFQKRCIQAVQEMEADKFAIFHRQREQPDERVAQLQREVNRQAEVIDRLESQLRTDDSRRYRNGYGYYPSPKRGRWFGVPWRYPGFYGYGLGYWGGKGIFPKSGGGKRSRRR